MEKKTIEVAYTIKPKENQERWGYNQIESNIAGEELVDWRISKSLSDELISKSASLKGEQLLVQYAEMQRRQLEETVAGLDDLELTIKTKTENVRQTLSQLLGEQKNIWVEQLISMQDSLTDNEVQIKKSIEKVKPMTDTVNKLKTELDFVNAYQVQKFVDVVEKIMSVQRDNPSLFEFISTNFKFNRQ